MQMLISASGQGVGRVIATPHVTPGVTPFSMEKFSRQLERAQRGCRQMQLPLQIIAGAEILYTVQTSRMLCERRIPTLGGTSFVLVEFSPTIRFDEIEDATLSLLRNGFLPVLAHVERYPALFRKPGGIKRLKREYEVFFQVNCSSIIACLKRWKQRDVKYLLQEEMVDFVASDAHDLERRPCRMGSALEALQTLTDSAQAIKMTSAEQIFSR